MSSVNLHRTSASGVLEALAEGDDQQAAFWINDQLDQMEELVVIVEAGLLNDPAQNPEMVCTLQTQVPGSTAFIDVDQVALDNDNLTVALRVNPSTLPIIDSTFRVLVSVSDDTATGAAVDVTATACFDRASIDSSGWGPA